MVMYVLHCNDLTNEGRNWIRALSNSVRALVALHFSRFSTGISVSVEGRLGVVPEAYGVQYLALMARERQSSIAGIAACVRDCDAGGSSS